MRDGCGRANAKVLVKTNGYRSIAGSLRTDGVPKLLGRVHSCSCQSPNSEYQRPRWNVAPHQPPTSQPSTMPVLFSPRDTQCRKCNKQPFHLHYIASCLTSHLNCLTMRRDALGDRNIKFKKRQTQEAWPTSSPRLRLNYYQRREERSKHTAANKRWHHRDGIITHLIITITESKSKSPQATSRL